jgi:hypothetical protein
VNGTWRSTQYAAGTSSATAGSLVGYGIKAISTTLNQKLSVTAINTNYTVGDADRASAFVWTGGAGAFTLPGASSVGNDWFFQIRNGGTGAITLTPSGSELINGAASLTFNPGDSAIILCDGSNFFTIGFGQSATFAFDYVSIDLTGQPSPYTLSGANLNRISYSFGGVLTTNTVVYIPATIQQYWISNNTSGAFTFIVKVQGQTGVLIPQGARGIYYCNGTDLIDADTASVSFPITVTQGGTNATTAAGARVNLGGTSVGIGVFTATTAADGRVALSAAASGANSDITSLTGLTTPLSVPQGGTGAATFTANGILYGSGAGAVSVTAAGTTGQVLIGNTGSAPSWSALSGLGVTSFNAGTTGLTPSTATTGAITLSGTLIAANGGTGFASYTVGDILYASTTTDLSKLADVATGNALISGGVGVAPSYGKIGLTTHVSGTLAAGNGGTGQTSYTIGDLLYADTASTINKLADVATGNALISGGIGVAPSYGKIGLTTHVSGTLPTANGGTNLTSFTSGGAVYATSTSALTTGTLPVGSGGTGATTLTGYVKGNSVYAFTASSTIPASDISSGAALSKTDDTNVTLTLGGSPTTALLAATSLTLGWTGQLGVARGGTGAATLTGYVKGTGTAALTASATIPASDISSGAALTKTDDTNVTLTLGGTPASALLAATSITAGWTGQLAVSRGGTGAATLTGIVVGNGTSAFTTVTAPSGTIVGTTDTQTLTNKRVTPRMNSQTTTTSPWAWNSDSYDIQAFTALANALTINADAGTPTDGQRAIFRFKDNGTARALTWTTGATKAFRAIGVTLPTTTVISKTVYVGCIYNSADSRWDAVAVSQEA